MLRRTTRGRHLRATRLEPSSEPAGPPSSAPAPSTYLAWLGGWRLAVVLLIDQAIVLTITGLLAPQFGPREPFKGDWDQLVARGGGLVGAILSNWQRWDGLWYQHIAEVGYHAGDGSAAFFPLYPVLSRLLSFVLAGNIVVAELVVSSLAYVGAMWLLWNLVRLEVLRMTGGRGGSGSAPGSRLPLTVPLLTVLLTALFPTGFFLLAPYTESLFLLLTAASFWFMRSGRLWAAGIAGFLASLTRAQGIFLALPLAYEHVRARGTVAWLRGRGGRPPGVALLAAALPVAGMLVFTLYQVGVLGEHRVGVGAQTPWGYQVAAPWDVVISSWSYIIRKPSEPSAGIEFLNLLCLVAFSAIALVGARRLPLAYTLYALPSLGLLFFRRMWLSPLMAVNRYVLVLFPCFVVIALWLAPRPKLATAWLVLSLVLQLVLFQYWVRWGFVA